MKIFVTGTRGIPDIPGGVEKHCQELYPRIAALGHEVVLATRTPYVQERKNEWRGVRLEHIFAPRIKSLEAVVHTFLAVLKARLLSPDIVHIHAVGPGLLVPFARFLGLKVVVTNHGPDYDRQKWGRLAKTMLRLGEYLGGKFANQVIVISTVIAAIIQKRCGRDSNLIYNGVPLPEKEYGTEYLEKIGVEQGGYILAVARLVPEKGLHDLVEAFSGLKGDIRLVIAGDADHETGYSRKLKKMAAGDKRIILTGYITGEPLHQVFTHARLFVLPSYHEGLPIALLEALSYGLTPLVSDIPANKEVGLDQKYYFRCGSVDDLRGRLSDLMSHDIEDAEKKKFQSMVAQRYNWSEISRQTIAVYARLLN